MKLTAEDRRRIFFQFHVLRMKLTAEVLFSFIVLTHDIVVLRLSLSKLGRQLRFRG